MTADTAQPDLDALQRAAGAVNVHTREWKLAGGNEWISPIGITVAPDDGGVTSAEAEHIVTADPKTVLELVAYARDTAATLERVQAWLDPRAKSGWAVGSAEIRELAAIVAGTEASGHLETKAPAHA